MSAPFFASVCMEEEAIPAVGPAKPDQSQGK